MGIWLAYGFIITVAVGGTAYFRYQDRKKQKQHSDK